VWLSVANDHACGCNEADGVWPTVDEVGTPGAAGGKERCLAELAGWGHAVPGAQQRVF
jgi:hypothetical protein